MGSLKAPNFHPETWTLIEYVNGTLPDPVALAVESHLEWCALCRRDVMILQELAGHFLDRSDPVALGDGAWDEIAALLDEPLPGLTARKADLGDTPAAWPSPLRRFLASGRQTLSWTKVDNLFEEARLPSQTPGCRLSLLRADKGGYVPSHSHDGNEHLLVLEGGFNSNGVDYTKGDYAFVEAGHVHEPVANTDERCVCLLVLDGSLHFQHPNAPALNAMFRVDGA